MPHARTPLFACLAVASLTAGCSDERVHLRGESVSLTYSCDAVRAQAKAEPDHATIREYAINAVRDARQHDRLQAADSIISAYDAEDALRLEQSVVRYICEYGDVAEAARPVFPEPGSTPPPLVLARYPSGEESTPSRPFRLQDHRGEIVVLSFWSTWCAPCIREMPELERITERYGDRGVSVFGILHRDRPEAARRWLQENGYELQMLLDEDLHAANAYGVRGIPDTYIIGRDGKVARRGLGYGRAGQLEEVIQEMLGSGAPTS